MSYDIYFVRRDPGQSFDDALADLEASFDEGDQPELTESDLEVWEALLPRAREILGEIEVAEDEESTRQLVARDSGVELTLISGELEIHVPTPPPGADDLQLMSTVYALARAVEEETGLEGYDPQVGEPVSAALDDDLPTRRHWPDDPVDDEDKPTGRRRPTPPAALVGDPRPEMAPDQPAQPHRRWWEFWRS